MIVRFDWKMGSQWVCDQMESGWRFGDDVVRRVDLEGEKIKQEKEVALT